MRSRSLVAFCLPPAAAAAAAMALAGCGSSTSPGNRAAGTHSATAAAYHPRIDPSQFTTHITNEYWPIRPGTTWIYDGHKGRQRQHVVVVAKPTTKTIMGVTTMTVQDTVTVGNSVIENTTDWYAQDRAGNVWYFGEDSRDYDHGVLTSTQGSWRGGVGGAQPGIVLEAHPRPGGPTYRQEYRPRVAEDMARVTSLTDAQTVPAGSFKHVLRTLETDPLNPDASESKYYAPGVGLVHVKGAGADRGEEIKLTKVVRR